MAPENKYRKFHTVLICRFLGDLFTKGRPMLSDHCPVCLSCLSVCNVGVLWCIA